MIGMEELKLLLPQIIIATTAVLVMLGIALRRNHLIASFLSLAGLVVALIYSLNSEPGQHFVSGLFIIDRFGTYLNEIILFSSAIIVLYSYPYFQIQTKVREEFYVLLLLATLGASFMTISNHFVSFALSLEVLSVSLFGLIGYMKSEKFSIEAGLKYLIMAAVATSFILFGFALIYMATGTMDLQTLGGVLRATSFDPLVLTGLALCIVGFGFKMALVPFHLWTPDIYAGAPAPASAFVATVSKGAAFVFLLRLFYSIGGLTHPGIWISFSVVAVASMFIGNWLALRQQNIKRLLAYSSISHLGYVMIAFLAFSVSGMRASAFYLTIYFISMLAAFGMIIYLSGKKGEPIQIEDYRGLFWSKPWLAAFFSVVMLSLAGVPFTAGFMGKFYLLGSGMNSGGLFLLICLVISSTIGLFYYLRIISVMLSKGNSTIDGHIGARSWILKLIVGVLFVLLLWYGMYPSVFLKMLTGI